MTEDITDTTDPATTGHAGLADAPLSEADHERFERNHYFHGKLMTARDMAAEQAYHAGQRRAHARSVAGSGVAWGLETTVHDDGEDAITVSVGRGYAIDECGRAILVPSDRETTVPRQAVDDADEVTVELVYEACLKESVPVSGAESACEDECAYNRVLEAYRIEVSEGTPSTAAKPVPDLTFPELADYDRSGREQPAAGDPALAGVAASYRDATRATTGEPGSGRVFVGAFAAPTDGGEDAEWRSLADAYPRPLVYTNDMLYAATARHAADFENPHEVTLATGVPDEGSGAQVRVRDDGRDDPDVTVASGDGSVDVRLADDRTIDLSVADHVDAVVAERIDPLERYAVERALKYTALVFRHASERFAEEATDAADVADRIARLARGASDGRLDAESDAAAADELAVLGEDWSEVRRLRGDVYEQLAEELAGLTDEFAGAIEETVTEGSYRRLDVALERLRGAIEADDRPAEPLPVATAQDDLADAVEWLEPVEDEEPETPAAAFTSSTYATHRGDVAEFSVDLGDADVATLQVGSEERNYRTTLEVEPAGGDRATILLNTYLAGRTDDEAAAYATADPDTGLTVTRETEGFDPVLATGTYELRLSVDDEETDVAVLSVLARSTDDLSVLAADDPDRYDDLDAADAIGRAFRAGDLRETDTVEPGHPLVLAVEATGVFGAIAAAGDGDPTTAEPDGLRTLVEDEELVLAVQGRRAGGEKRLPVWENVEAGNARILFDPGAGELFVVVDTDAAVLVEDGRATVSEDAGFEYGEAYEAGFTVLPASGLAAERESVSALFSTGRPPTVTVPDVVGRPEGEARKILTGTGLSTGVEFVPIETGSQLSTDYDAVLSQSPAAGDEATEGSQVTLEVLVSRPVTILQGIAERRADRLADAGVEWVHDLADANVRTLARATDFSQSQLADWQARAQEYLTGLHASLRFQVDAEAAEGVVDAFEDVDYRQIAELDQSTVETRIANATDHERVDPTAAQEFLASGRGVRFDESTFQYDFEDVIVDEDIDLDTDL